METGELNVVTGSFGFSGKYITRRLLAMGKSVRTLTGHPDRDNPFGERVSIAPFNFDRPGELVRSLLGATTLYVTYWVRFPYGQVTYEKAVENTKTLIRAAEEAGLRRIVYVSISSPSEDSPFTYFRGKAYLEKAIAASGLSYAIIRPTVLFGPEDILINNIAWLLRRFPVFAVPGSGEYRVQPVFVGDLAEIAVSAGQKEDNRIIEAGGPEVFTFNELVRLIATMIGSRARIVNAHPGLTLFLSRLVSYAIRDVLLTRDEVGGLLANLLVSSGPTPARTRLSEWLAENAHIVGTRHMSELGRHYR